MAIGITRTTKGTMVTMRMNTMGRITPVTVTVVMTTVSGIAITASSPVTATGRPSALGGVVGGVIGSSVGSPQNREVAIIVGAVVGSVIGHEIGQDMDRADRGCIGHALELAHDGQSVQWRNAQRGIDYRVTPVGPWTRGGSDCRQFKVRVQKGGRAETQTGHACRSGDGEWRMT
jgi:surface antigen